MQSKNSRRGSVKLILLLLLICTMALIAQYCWPVSSPKDMSAEETVAYYFQQFSNQNRKAMNAVVYSKMRGQSFDLQGLNYVKLLLCEEEQDDARIPYQDNWFPNPYASTMVNVTFEINYRDGYGNGFSNATYHWQYYLVKENEMSNWIIVMWGAG